MPKTKTYRAKMEMGTAEGSIEVVFATLDVVDHDGDVTLPGAFNDGQEVVIEPWNHNWQAPPIGAGTIRVQGNEARMTGQFFMGMTAARDHYAALKGLADMGAMAEWSYTFNVMDAEPGMKDGRPVVFLKKLDVIGVGPVTRGAGLNTRTVDIKARQDGDVEGEQDQARPGESSKEPPAPTIHRDAAAVEIEILTLEAEELG